jgi:hypothetical protein
MHILSSDPFDVNKSTKSAMWICIFGPSKIQNSPWDTEKGAEAVVGYFKEVSAMFVEQRKTKSCRLDSQSWKTTATDSDTGWHRCCHINIWSHFKIQ